MEQLMIMPEVRAVQQPRGFLPIKWAAHSWTVAADTEHVSPWAHGCPWGLAVRQPDSCLRILLGRLVGFLSKGIESTSGNRGGETRKLWPPFLSAGETTFAEIFLSRQSPGKIRTSQVDTLFPMAEPVPLCLFQRSLVGCVGTSEPQKLHLMGNDSIRVHTLRVYLIRCIIPKPRPPPAIAPSPRNSPEMQVLRPPL